MHGIQLESPMVLIICLDKHPAGCQTLLERRTQRPGPISMSIAVGMPWGQQHCTSQLLFKWHATYSVELLQCAFFPCNLQALLDL